MTKKLFKSRLVVEKTTETKQHSNAIIRKLPKPSTSNIPRKRILLKICSSEASKTSVPYVEKIHFKQKTLKNSKEKRQTISSNRSFSI